MGSWESLGRDAVHGVVADQIIDFALKHRGEIPGVLKGLVNHKWPYAETLLPAVYVQYNKTALEQVNEGNYADTDRVARGVVHPMVVDAMITYSGLS